MLDVERFLYESYGFKRLAELNEVLTWFPEELPLPKEIVDIGSQMYLDDKIMGGFGVGLYCWPEVLPFKKNTGKSAAAPPAPFFRNRPHKENEYFVYQPVAFCDYSIGRIREMLGSAQEDVRFRETHARDKKEESWTFQTNNTNLDLLVEISDDLEKGLRQGSLCMAVTLHPSVAGSLEIIQQKYAQTLLSILTGRQLDRYEKELDVRCAPIPPDEMDYRAKRREQIRLGLQTGNAQRGNGKKPPVFRVHNFLGPDQGVHMKR